MMEEMTCRIKLIDRLPTKTSDLAVCVIPANKEAMDQLDITRDNILQYAQKCNADYIELTGDQAPEWPMSNKYRLKQVIENYEHTLYLDCDIVIKKDAPNIYEELASDKVCFVNEWDIIESSSHLLFKAMKLERKMAVQEYPHLAKNNRDIQPNGGVMLFPKKLAYRYSQPPSFYPKRWCFDQDYLLLNLEDNEFELIDWKYNLEFIDFDFWSKIEDAHFIHLNGSRPLDYRLRLLNRLVNKEYSFLPQPEPKENDSIIDRFRPNWRTEC